MIGLSHINTDATPGDDVVAIKASFSIATSFASLDPQGKGAMILLRNAGGGSEVSVTLAGGAYGGRGSRGWKRNSKGTKWTFQDTTGSAANGFSKLVILDQGAKAPNRVRVIASGKDGTYPVIAGDEPVQVILVLGDQDSGQAGECGESAFVAGECVFDAPGTHLTCKK